ncbi:hypothetical protein GLP30_09435 [Photobacterium phosphoreum]|uniref:Uncharacterized protein n=1 Tax=Photobacterium phosphoreum TaxID=659 RepID=A0AAW4ZNZ5_PHOPO|nr:hypothetical protein [Photobacterium phosphoreum]MCD9491080.1 hypothetical protein [Photobacterium phosphoreum]MCF2190310.1 hypothetical protein [Photobacterium phosphoreum]MCF2300897.1 hypothetical protein [Photobacterium phosphoreum]
MNKLFLDQLQLLCADLKQQSQEAEKLAKERPHYAGYFEGLAIGRMQAYIAIECLVEKRDIAGSFSGPSRAVVVDGDFTEVTK